MLVAHYLCDFTEKRSGYRGLFLRSRVVMYQSVIIAYPEITIFVPGDGVDKRIFNALIQGLKSVSLVIQTENMFSIIQIGEVFIIHYGENSADNVRSLLLGSDTERLFF